MSEKLSTQAIKMIDAVSAVHQEMERRRPDLSVDAIAMLSHAVIVRMPHDLDILKKA